MWGTVDTHTLLICLDFCAGQLSSLVVYVATCIVYKENICDIEL
jgi:hypothetical protein